MAEAEVTVDVTPQTSVSLTAPPINTEPLAAALLKSSENQAAATMTLAAALRPQSEPALPGGKKKSQAMNAVLLVLIVFLIWK